MQESVENYERLRPEVVQNRLLFHSAASFPIVEMSQTYLYSIAIPMANIQTRFILYFA